MAQASGRTVSYPASGGWETFTGDAAGPVIRVRFPDGAEVAYRPSQRDTRVWQRPVAAVLAEAVTLAGVTVDVNATVNSSSGKLLSLYVIRTGVAGAELEGLSPEGRERVLFEIAQDAVNNVVSWGYEEVPGDDS